MVERVGWACCAAIWRTLAKVRDRAASEFDGYGALGRTVSLYGAVAYTDGILCLVS